MTYLDDLKNAIEWLNRSIAQNKRRVEYLASSGKMRRLRNLEVLIHLAEREMEKLKS